MTKSVSRRDVLQRMGFAGLAGALQAAGVPVAFAQQGQQLLVVQWGAAWIDVSRKIVEEFEAKTGDKITWETHAGGAMAIIAKIKPVRSNRIRRGRGVRVGRTRAGEHNHERRVAGLRRGGQNR